MNPKLWSFMKFDTEFLRRIKTRIALTFSLLFIVFTVPAIIYAVNQVNLFFNGIYLEQMRAVGLALAAVSDMGELPDSDSLTAEVSRITGSNVVLFAESGEILARRFEGSAHDTSSALYFPILRVVTDTTAQFERIQHKFVQRGGRRYLQVQTELAGGMKLLQVKSLQRVTMVARRVREVIIWSSFLGLIALIAVAFWVSANISRPIERLTEFARQIRTGENPSPTDIRSPDEVGDLADVMNAIVSDLNRARDRMDHLETVRRDFFANIGQELERPLGKINGALADLRRSPELDAAARESLDQAAAQTRGLQRIIHTLMEISALEYGEVSLAMRSFPLADLIKPLADKYHGRIESRGLEFVIEMTPEQGAMRMRGDRRLLRIVLRNLLNNAIDFTEKGIIKIIVADEGEKAKITVEDTGPGIPQEEVDRIFERFYRVKTGQPRDDERPGLGLAMAKHIMEAHGQKLEAESTLGVGSKFSIWLDRFAHV
jgi:signal transduction histidine kinase